MDDIGDSLRQTILEQNVEMLLANKIQPTALANGLVPVEISNSVKENSIIKRNLRRESTQYEENLYKASYRNNNAGFDASYLKSDNIRFPSTYKNISSVEQQYFSIGGNADTVRLSSIV